MTSSAQDRKVDSLAKTGLAKTSLAKTGLAGTGLMDGDLAGTGQFATGAEPPEFRRERRLLVIHSPQSTGLDYVTAHPDPRYRTVWWLALHFLPGPPPPPGCESKRVIPEGIEPASIRIRDADGEAVEGLEIVAVRYPKSGVTLNVILRANGPLAERLRHDAQIYTLKLVDVPDLDRFFSSADFRFDGSGELPATPTRPLPDSSEQTIPPDLNYLAKDYASLRKLMLTHMTRVVPSWSERNPADLGVAIIEVLAYAADYLSYQQDAAATEAYLQTARRRVSVRRHARLLGYYLHEGWNTRLWIFVRVARGDDAQRLPRGSQILTNVESMPSTIPYPSAQYNAAIDGGALVFETLYSVTLHHQHNEIAIYPWATWDYTLPAGTTTATLDCRAASLCEEPGRRPWPPLTAGDVVLFEQTRSPRTGRHRDADLELRHAVRLLSVRPISDPLAARRELIQITWHPQDALPFDLPVVDHRWRNRAGKPRPLAVARGNLVLADYGRTIEEELPAVPAGRRYRVTLETHDVISHQPYYPARERRRPASYAGVQDPEKTVPAVALFELDELEWRAQGDLTQPLAGEPWQARRDLLESTTSDRHFVAEMESDRSAHLRFGDGREGMRPAPGSRFWAYYRVGSGNSADVGPGAATHLVTDNPHLVSARSPLPATTGESPQTLIEARFEAPWAFHEQQRCITPADYVDRAKRQPQVIDAACRLYRHGTWLRAVVRIQRRGAQPADRAFLARVRAFLEPCRALGYDLSVRPATWVSLAVALEVRVADDALRDDVRQRLLDALGNRRLPNGKVGFFYPDAHGFGQSIELTAILERAGEVSGVVSVSAVSFGRWQPKGVPFVDVTIRGLVRIRWHEIARLANDPRRPWHGTLKLKLWGGR